MAKKFNFRKTALNPLRLYFYFLMKMPLGFFSGMKVKRLDDKQGLVYLPYSYVTKNPFQSVYFAAQAMAAEFSSGILAFNQVINAPLPVSMLVLKMDAEFTKKARSGLHFRCDDGDKIARAIAATINTGEGTTCTVTATGRDQDNEVVSVFHFVWTFKKK